MNGMNPSWTRQNQDRDNGDTAPRDEKKDS